jgi:hypothetical protein
MPTSRAARRSHAVASAPTLALALAGTAFALTLAGCASQAMPKVDYPTPAAGTRIADQQSVQPVAPIQPVQPVVPITPAPSYTGYAPPYNAITARISGLPSGATLTYPMPWLTFSVTLTNTSTFAFHGLDPLLVFGQCTCSPHAHGIAPSVNLQRWDAGSGTWKNIRASEMSERGVYKYASQLGSVDLGPKAAATYRYRLQLSRTLGTGKRSGYVDGTGSLNVYVLQLPKHTRLSAGLDPEAAVPLAYRFGG